MTPHKKLSVVRLTLSVSPIAVLRVSGMDNGVKP